MNRSDNNRMIRALAFEKAILEILKKDNPSLNENYIEKHNEYRLSQFQYDAVSYGSLNLHSFEMETIYAGKIVIEIKAVTQLVDIISRFYERVENYCDAIVFFLAGKKPKGIEEKIRSSAKCRVYFIDAEQLKRNKTINAILKKFDEYKNSLDNHYAAGYEDFCVDANDVFPNLDFDSFKIPLATESSLLQTSSEDVNVMDDASNEVTQDDPKSGGSAPSGLSN